MGTGQQTDQGRGVITKRAGKSPLLVTPPHLLVTLRESHHGSPIGFLADCRRAAGRWDKMVDSRELAVDHKAIHRGEISPVRGN